jgi:hypothetical protein
MKKLVFIALTFLTCYASNAQEEETLGQKIHTLSFDWDLMSSSLNNYEGLTKFCKDQNYRNEVIKLLNNIHHYDSVLYDRLVKASRSSNDKEIKKAIEQIEKFEDNYDMKSFLNYLHDDCKGRAELEKTAKESKSDMGENSYDGQIYIIELELNKYIKHITKRVDHIRKHVEHLHIK